MFGAKTTGFDLLKKEVYSKIGFKLFDVQVFNFINR